MPKRWILLVLMLTACQNPPGGAASAAAKPDTTRSGDKPRQVASAPGSANNQIVALVDSQPVTWDMLKVPLIEAAGGQTLSEWILDRRIESALKFKGLSVNEQDIAKERTLLVSQVSGDADTTARLIEQLKIDRGLGSWRFDQLIRRTAGMRKLVAEGVSVTDPMVRQLYEERFGPKTEVRMILSASLPEISKLMTRAQGGEPFTDLAIAFSKDDSRNQGGLLPPISMHDATFPKALRDAADKLTLGQISSPIALESGYALLKCERKIPGNTVGYESVADKLRSEVRLRVERNLMARQARTLMEGVDVTVLDADLNEAWKKQKRLIKEQNLDSK